MIDLFRAAQLREKLAEGARLQMVDYYARADRAANERERAENVESAVRLKGWIAMVRAMPAIEILEFFDRKEA